MKKKEEAQFRRCASAVPNLIASMFDIGSVEAQLWFRRRANVVRIQHLLKHPQPIANIWFTVTLESCNTAGLVELKYLIASLNLIKKFNSDAGRAFAVL